MHLHTTYCCERDREVRVGWLGEQAELVCVDFSEECTGPFCPSSTLPSILMGVRLARSGLPVRQWRTFRAVCPDCEHECDLKVLSQDYLFCPLCQSTVHFREFEADRGACNALAGCA